MVSLDPSEGVGNLLAAFIDAIKSSEIVSERKGVRNIEIGLARGCREVVVTARVLHQEGIHQIWLKGGVDAADQTLIAEKGVMAVARRSDASAIQGVSDQHIQITSIENAIVDVKPVVGADLMVKANEPVVVVEGLEDVQIFSGHTQGGFRGVNGGQVARQGGGKCGRLAEALAFVVHEKESLVLTDGAAQGGSELTAAILVVLRGFKRDRELAALLLI